MMRLTPYRLALAGLAIGLFLAGCPSQQRLDREFRARRQAAYHRLIQTDPNQIAADLRVVSGGLTLADCLELALRHNKDVQIAKVKLLEAKGQMQEAVATALPQAGFTGSALRNDNTGFNLQKETYELQLLARQPLYLGGLTGAAVDAASVYTYMTQQELRQTLHQVELSVRQMVLNALLARELIEVARQAQRDAARHLQDTQARLTFGTGTRFEVLRAQVRVQTLQAEWIQRRNDYRLAITQLLNEMGVSQLSQMELEGELEFTPVTAAASESLREAMQQRPELLIGEALIRLARDQVKSERSSNLPKVYLQGLYMLSYPGFSSNFSFGGGQAPADPDEGQDEEANPFASLATGGKQWERTMNGGIVVEWPFFDGFRTDGRVVQAKAQVHRQLITLRQLEEQVQMEVTQTILNLQSSAEFVQSQQGNVENAEESLRLAQIRFREGAGTSLDVISAETALQQARSDLARAVRDHQTAALALEYATGRLGEDSYQAVKAEAPETIKQWERMNP